MSLVRFSSKSDVYVYYDVGGFINCCGCRLSHKDFHAGEEQQMIDHLIDHQKSGHHVPKHVFKELSEIQNAG